MAENTQTKAQQTFAGLASFVPVVGGLLSKVIGALNLQGSVSFDVQIEYPSEAAKKSAIATIKGHISKIPDAVKKRTPAVQLANRAIELIEGYAYVVSKPDMRKKIYIRGEEKESTWKYYYSDPSTMGEGMIQFTMDEIKQAALMGSASYLPAGQKSAETVSGLKVKDNMIIYVGLGLLLFVVYLKKRK